VPEAWRLRERGEVGGTRNFGDAGERGGWLRRILYEERDCDGTVKKGMAEGEQPISQDFLFIPIGVACSRAFVSLFFTKDSCGFV